MSRFSLLRSLAVSTFALVLSAATLAATYAFAGGEPVGPAAARPGQPVADLAAVTQDPAAKSALDEAVSAVSRLATSPGLLAEMAKVQAESPVAKGGGRRRPIELVARPHLLAAKLAPDRQVSIVAEDAGGVLATTGGTDFGGRPTVSQRIKWPTITITIEIKIGGHK